MSLEYATAAAALAKVLAGTAGVKSAIFGAPARNVRRVYAIVCETLRHAGALEAAVAGIPTLHAAVDAGCVDRALLYILAYELLWGAGRITGGGATKRLVLENAEALRAATGCAEPPPGEKMRAVGSKRPRAADDGGGVAAGGVAPEATGRWVRVNTLLCTVDSAVAVLLDASQSPTGVALSAGSIAVSAFVPYMLLLPHDAHATLALHDHVLVRSGRLVLQDLPSALPPHALLGDDAPSVAAATLAAPQGEGSRRRWGDVVDACAAPGNKTTQLAALVAAVCSGSDAGQREGEGGGDEQTRAAKKRRKAHAKRAAQRRALAAERQVGRAAGPLDDSTPDTAAAASIAPPVIVNSLNAGERGRVLAFDRDEERLALLAQRVVSMGAGAIVTPTCADFLSLDVHSAAFYGVTAVLLDPSCSGSGMRARWGGLEGAGGHGGQGAMQSLRDLGHASPSSLYIPPDVTPRDAARVRSLAAFQTRALAHALSFPHVRRVVYSTCSLYVAEDEAVVASALRAFNAAGGRTARLIPALPAWPLRGVAAGREGLAPNDAALCVRWDPAWRGAAPAVEARGGALPVTHDLGDTGFFVALIEVCV